MEINTKICIKCKELFAINTENFYRNNKAEDGFLNTCKTCHNSEKRRRKNEKTATKVCKKCETRHNLNDFGKDPSALDGKRDWCYVCHDAQIKENDTKKLVRAKNSRKHNTITLNKHYVVKRTGVIKEAMQDRLIRGKFIDNYSNFLLFQTNSGTRECFRKNDIGIDWEIK